MERKREHGESASTFADGSAKRLHLDVDAGDDDGSPDYQRLEHFRKEAIYRCLREAKRECHRAYEQEAQLQSQISRMQHSVLLVNQFWDALAEQVRMARPVDDDVLASMQALVPLSLTHTSEEQEAALHERRALLEKVLTRAAQGASTSSIDDTQKRCTQLSAELSAIRQSLDATQMRLAHSFEHAASVAEKLRRAEKRLDRSASESVRAVEDPHGYAQKQQEDVKREEPEAPKSAPDEAPAGPSADAIAAMQQELEGVRDLAHARQHALESVRAELLEAKQACTQWQQQLQHLPDDRIRAHPMYQALHADVACMQQEMEQLRSAFAVCERENAEMREFRAEFLHQTTKQANTHSDELQKQLRARDADIARLRGQRDELNAELLERRSRENVRFAHVDEAKALIAPKEERLVAMQAQVKRLESELEALKSEAPPGDGDVVSLQRRLNAANSSSAMLCDEVDRLSAAYDQLEKQAVTRVANVARLEDKILRLTTEKAKADNKYFAAMRAKDALDAEKRALARSAERQAKVIERYTDTERALQAQIQLAEKELTALRKSVHTQNTRLNEAERDVSVLRRRHAEAERARQTAEASAAQHQEAASKDQAARQAAEERASALDREAGRLRRRVAESSAMRRRGSEREHDTHLEHLNTLLRCSACKERYRDRIILRCLHTFCEACVNARIQTRQRKCPHCGLAFATSDVQILYCTFFLVN